MPQSWPASPGPSRQSSSGAQMINDDDDDVAESGANASGGSKHVRRRSSKACDQCRKSKCKCERSALGEPCKSCIMLGTPCTFLGPSRKRGPPKGYIDAIEARLHQTEALLGIMIAAKDPRAQSLLRDISKDTLAKEIINRVDNSPYGVKGRKRGDEPVGKLRPTQGHGQGNPGSGSESSRSSQKPEGQDSPKMDLTSTHPSNEWQDRVTAMLHGSSSSRDTSLGKGINDVDSDYGTADQHHRLEHQHQQRLRAQQSEPSLTSSYTNSMSYTNSSSNPHSNRTHGYPHTHTHSLSQPSTLTHARPPLRVNLNSADPVVDQPMSPSSRRQRRRLDPDINMEASPFHSHTHSLPHTLSHPHTPTHLEHMYSSGSASMSQRGVSPGGRLRYGYETSHPYLGSHSTLALTRSISVSSTDTSSGDEEDGELTGAVGQLSLNEEEQVRYHGKVSGLHLLGAKERVDARNEGGIWRFPKARVWPMAPSALGSKGGEDELMTAQLPDPAVQEHLLELYFTFVHPSFPVVHKRAFFEGIKNGVDSPRTPEDTSTTNSPFNQRRQRVPALLLLTMYALAARFSPDPNAPPPADPSLMWAAGDEYLDRAKVLLDGTYATSRPSTCQALLLMGYREIGIGAMAQAWTYVGMAIRMAQDLGMHRSADGWARVELGGRLFGEWELQERKRVWFACVIMDKYVSTYIGRPLMIFERDFDTPLPGENDPEEMEEWSSSFLTGNIEKLQGIPSRVISCFNASAVLSGILGKIVQAIYAVHTVPNRHVESTVLEGLLDKWYIELPQHLRLEPGSTKRPVPPPHILTLHMQYWCAVLLLHRPFIRHHMYNPRNHRNDDSTSEGEARKTSEKSYELCAGAANHITSIATLYSDTYTLSRCSVFLCYYIFTASIMHVTNLTAHPSDPQARMGLAKCMEALHMMEIVWPSAGRALELLRGSKFNLEEPELAALSNHPARYKRSADHLNDASDRTRSLDDINYSYLEPRAPNYQYTAQGSYVSLPPPTQLDAQTNPGGPSPQTPYPPPSYDRWALENSGTTAFPGTLSTSVLPQIYSTGLVDDRAPVANTRVHTHSQSEQPRASHAARYPQYWHDYSTFPQLGTAYVNYQDSSPAPVAVSQQQQQQHTQQHQHQHQQHQQHHLQPHHDQQPASSHVYLSEPYHVYNNLAPLNR